MAFLVSSVLPFMVAAVMAIACAMSSRDLLTRPFVYGAVCFLLVLGMHHLLQALLELAKYVWPLGHGYFLVARPTTESEIAAIERKMIIEGFAIAAVVAVFSYPVITFIWNGFEK